MTRINEIDAPLPRYGHTAVLYRREIYIYGGSTPREYFKPREDILVYNLSNLILILVHNRFSSERAYNRNDVYWRRNHVAIAIANNMFVHGGIDEHDKMLNDVWLLEMNTFRWNKLEYKGIKPTALAFHCADLVIHPEKLSHPGFNFYRSPEINIMRNKSKRIKVEGIYLFGGQDENRNYTNEVRVLKVGRKPCEWVYPKITGMPPLGRINAQCNYYSELNVLIINGGRNDKEKKFILNDIWILDLENLCWIRALVNPSLFRDRTDHRSVIHGDKLILLGGNNSYRCLPMDICIIQLDLYNMQQTRRKEKPIELLKRQAKESIKTDFLSFRPKKASIIETVNINKEIIPFIDQDRLDELKKLTKSGTNDSKIEDN